MSARGFCPPLTSGVSGDRGTENVDGGSGAGLRALCSDCGEKGKGMERLALTEGLQYATHCFALSANPNTTVSILHMRKLRPRITHEHQVD